MPSCFFEAFTQWLNCKLVLPCRRLTWKGRPARMEGPGALANCNAHSYTASSSSLQVHARRVSGPGLLARASCRAEAFRAVRLCLRCPPVVVSRHVLRPLDAGALDLETSTAVERNLRPCLG